jgi:phosphotransferase system  glucose/maltose/N-acetylglucosamine-specific IIC component|tara:strand:+ start:1090 stop:1374 length:285 start_codon:yes stop_codon:yes gene_type:complete
MNILEILSITRDVVLILIGVFALLVLILVVRVLLKLNKVLDGSVGSIKRSSKNLEAILKLVLDALVRPLIPTFTFYSGVKAFYRAVNRYWNRKP